jgi:Restriction endonuclease
VHRIDVWVRFRKFGLEIKWVIECKHWTSAVSKEKVLALKSVVEDVGADRGILISESRFQSGAIRASQKTNITLTDLEGLMKSAQEDLMLSLLDRVQTRAVKLNYALLNLYDWEKRDAHSLRSKLRPGADGIAITRAMGKIAGLDFGFDRVRLKKPPYPVGFDDTGNKIIAVDTLEEFIRGASRQIDEAEATLNSQQV